MQYHKTSMLTKKEIKDLKARLPRGYFKKTIQRSGLSERTVAKFFSGDSYNIDVHNAAVEVAEEYEAQKSILKTRQKSISHAK